MLPRCFLEGTYSSRREVVAGAARVWQLPLTGKRFWWSCQSVTAFPWLLLCTAVCSEWRWFASCWCCGGEVLQRAPESLSGEERPPSVLCLRNRPLAYLFGKLRFGGYSRLFNLLTLILIKFIVVISPNILGVRLFVFYFPRVILFRLFLKHLPEMK